MHLASTSLTQPARQSVADAASPLTLMRVLQLASPALPVGAYAYSQGIEWLVEEGSLKSADDVERWIESVLTQGLARFDLPLIAACHTAWSQGDAREAKRLNQLWITGREASELRAESAQMGHALRKLALDLDLIESTHDSLTWPEASVGTMFSLIAQRLDVLPLDCVATFAFSWVENQVLAAVKAIPLGQAAGQRLILKLAAHIPTIAQNAITLDEDAWENFQPGLALASCQHETQYTRLFRS